MRAKEMAEGFARARSDLLEMQRSIDGRDEVDPEDQDALMAAAERYEKLREAYGERADRAEAARGAGSV